MTQRDAWNARYGEGGAVWGIGPNEFVTARVSGMAPCRVLDLGSGQGRNAIWLAQQGHTVTAIDISDVAIAQGNQIARDAGVEVEFIAADLATWEPVAETFDLVVLAYLHAPEAGRKALHAKAVRSLAAGGKVLVVAHHRDNLEHGFGGPPMLEVLFDEAALATDFAGLDVLENQQVLRRVEKGDQAGDAIDIVFIGQKRG